MMSKKTEVLVVGGGQAGIATSEHLSTFDIPHLVLEKGRIAESWRSQRWDSLVANGPAWHDRFPNMEFAVANQDDFPTKEEVAEYFTVYAQKYNVPIRTSVEVKKAQRNIGKRGFTVTTSEGVIETNYLVVATGPFQVPVIPSIAPNTKNNALQQLHSAAYRNPKQLKEGAVLVVGAGSSGAQIAEELQFFGKKVYLSLGAHARPPRSYRNRDCAWWLGVLGIWDAENQDPQKAHVAIAVSGSDGGKTVDFRKLAHQGIELTGMTKSIDNGVITFAPNLAQSLKDGDKDYFNLLVAADAYVERNGLDLPLEPEAYSIQEEPNCVTNPIRSLDIAKAGITAIVWATGFAQDFRWLDVSGAFDKEGKPQHQRGVSSEPGVYFVGLPWLSRRSSSFICGVWHDAKHIAEHIQSQRKYLAYTCSKSK